MINIVENYEKIINRIMISAQQCRRNPAEVKLVVVTKTQPIESIIKVIEAGAMDFGENYVEEALPKIHMLQGRFPINWHMIGHVQSRKSEQVVSNFQFLHSLDSYKLAEKVNRNLIDIKKDLPVWLEFNVSGEETKSGWNIWSEEEWDKILHDIEKIFSLPRLILLGAMAIPPYFENPEEARPYFRKLRKFQEYLITKLNLSDFEGLSIGMSSDFEVAIQEGSTCVRIGQAIFGPRNV